MPIKSLWRLTLLGAAWLLAGVPAGQAFELCNGAGDALTAKGKHAFDLGVSTSLVSDYLDRGITQTNHRAAAQLQIEAAYDIFYTSLFASTLDRDTEFQFAAGLRPTLGAFDFDFGIARDLRLTDPSEDETGFYGAVNFAATDALSLGAELDLSTTGDRCVEAVASFELPHGFEFTAELGAIDFRDADMVDYTAFRAGLSYDLSKWASVDLSYSGTSLSRDDCASNEGRFDACGARVMLGLTLKTSLSQRAGGAADRDD